MDLVSTFSNKKVFLTGHTGFKGCWMLYWLHLLGADVKGYALDPEGQSSLYAQINGDSLCESVIADIRDRQRVIKEIEGFQPDFVFHLAAQPLVRFSYKIPAETFEVNAIGTAHVLDGIHSLAKSCIGVMITTDKVYENKEWHYPYRENDRLGGYDPYSASKACTELVISSYRNSFFNPNNYKHHHKAIAVARAGNVIGGGDWAKDRIIPDIVRALSNGEPVQVRNPEAVRPWQHVLEPLSGYLLLGEKLKNDPVSFAKAYNFGPKAEDNLSVSELVSHAIALWGDGKFQTPELAGQPHEAGLLKLDINLAQHELSWKPKWDSSAAIASTINWYRENLAGQSASDLLMGDIQKYIVDVES